VNGRIVLVGLIGVGLAAGSLRAFGLRFNLTASLPLGIYRVSSEPPSRGSIVQVCLDSATADFAQARGYLGPGACKSGVRPLGKIVLAVEGDVVTFEQDRIRVNGEGVANSETASKDSRGRALPHYAWGEHRMGPGELWLFSPYHRKAFDSRYFGPVRVSQAVSVIEPLWTQGSYKRRARAKTW
jgi:conjugative transfer signal peptidase TraF